MRQFSFPQLYLFLHALFVRSFQKKSSSALSNTVDEHIQCASRRVYTHFFNTEEERISWESVLPNQVPKKVTRFTFKDSLLFFFPFLRGSFFSV